MKISRHKSKRAIQTYIDEGLARIRAISPEAYGIAIELIMECVYDLYDTSDSLQNRLELWADYVDSKYRKDPGPIESDEEKKKSRLSSGRGEF